MPIGSSVVPERTPEVSRSEIRFAFGENWQRFLLGLTEERIIEAEKSLCSMLEVDGLGGKSFLDIGCGSGLFSLAAMRLGAKVHSFDYDPQSVACAQELKRRYFQDSKDWIVEQGSVLDAAFLSRLGKFEIVYSWGVLHHTGDMWQALQNVVTPVATGGRLFIALYNDQEFVSKAWRTIKRCYSYGFPLRWPIVAIFGTYFLVRGLIKDVVILRRNPLRRFHEYKRSRGMSYFTDLLDWLGGYPFEVARPDEVFAFFRSKGFWLIKLKTAGGRHGNNEFVFINQRALD